MIYKEKRTKKKPEVSLKMYPDYKLSGSITNFEGYMFATIDKHIEEHTSFDEELVIANGNKRYETVSMLELSDRKNSLTKFNKMMKEIGYSIKANSYSCVMIDFFLEEEDWDMELFDESYQELKDLFLKWTKENNRIGVMVQHFYQGLRYPHVHILIQKLPRSRKKDEFQTYVGQYIK